MLTWKKMKQKRGFEFSGTSWVVSPAALGLVRSLLERRKKEVWGEGGRRKKEVGGEGGRRGGLNNGDGWDLLLLHNGGLEAGLALSAVHRTQLEQVVAAEGQLLLPLLLLPRMPLMLLLLVVVVGHLATLA